MRDDNDSGIIGLIIVLFIVLAIIYISVLAFLTIGAGYGAFTTVKNYVGAFRDNVGPEKGLVEA